MTAGRMAPCSLRPGPSPDSSRFVPKVNEIRPLIRSTAARLTALRRQLLAQAAFDRARSSPAADHSLT